LSSRHQFFISPLVVTKKLERNGIMKELFYFNLYSPGDLEKSKTFYRKVFGWEIGGGSLGGHVNNAENTPCGVSPGGSYNAVYFCTFGTVVQTPS
jgi:hypothetical protein